MTNSHSDSRLITPYRWDYRTSKLEKRLVSAVMVSIADALGRNKREGNLDGESSVGLVLAQCNPSKRWSAGTSALTVQIGSGRTEPIGGNPEELADAARELCHREAADGLLLTTTSNLSQLELNTGSLGFVATFVALGTDSFNFDFSMQDPTHQRTIKLGQGRGQALVWVAFGQGENVLMSVNTSGEIGFVSSSINLGSRFSAMSRPTVRSSYVFEPGQAALKLDPADQVVAMHNTITERLVAMNAAHQLFDDLASASPSSGR